MSDFTVYAGERSTEVMSLVMQDRTTMGGHDSLASTSA